VDHHIRPEGLDGRPHLHGVGNVQFGEVEGQQGLMDQPALERCPELPFAAHDSDAHYPPPSPVERSLIVDALCPSALVLLPRSVLPRGYYSLRSERVKHTPTRPTVQYRPFSRAVV